MMTNNLEEIGRAQLLAHEGQRQMAHALASACGALLLRMVNAIGRYLPESKMTPW